MLKCSGLKGPTRVEVRTFGKKVAEKVQQHMSNVTTTSSCFASTAAGDPISLVLTEQRLHHLSLLKLDQKLDTVLAGLAKLENVKESFGKEDAACQTDDAPEQARLYFCAHFLPTKQLFTSSISDSPPPFDKL